MYNKIQVIIDSINIIDNPKNIRDKYKFDPILVGNARNIFDDNRFNSLVEYDGLNRPRISSELHWEWLLEREFDCMKIGLKERWFYVSQLKKLHSLRRQLVSIIRQSIKQDDIDNAIHYNDKLNELELPKGLYKNNVTYGFRYILRYYAKFSDLKNFMTTLKKCEINKFRAEIANAKGDFIYNYSVKNGILDSIKICNKNVFGTKYFYNMLLPYSENNGYDNMTVLLSDDMFKELDNNVKVRLLVNSFCFESNKGVSIPPFEKIFNIVDKIDSQVKFGDCKLRDILLWDISRCISNIEQVKKCKKAVRGRHIKKELDALINTL